MRGKMIPYFSTSFMSFKLGTLYRGFNLASFILIHVTHKECGLWSIVAIVLKGLFSCQNQNQYLRHTTLSFMMNVSKSFCFAMEIGLSRRFHIFLHPFFEFQVGHPLLRINLIQFYPDPSNSYRMWIIIGIVLMSPFSCQYQN